MGTRSAALRHPDGSAIRQWPDWEPAGAKESHLIDVHYWPTPNGWKITIALGQFPNVRRWYDALKQRPGLRRGVDVGKDLRKAVFAGPDDQARKNLFEHAGN